MAKPYPSWVITISDEPTVHHLLAGPTMANAHESIIRANGLASDAVMRVELHADMLETGEECCPWTIDRMPSGYRYLDQLPQAVLDKGEESAANFMTPDNILTYLQVNPDAVYLAKALFTPEYIAKNQDELNRQTGADDSETTVNNIIGRAHTGLCKQLDPAATLTDDSVASPLVIRDIIPFTRDDIKNPAIWKELP